MVVATQGSRMVTVPTAWFWGVAGLLVVLILMVVSLLVMVVSRGSDGPAQPVVAGESPSPSSSPSPSPSPSVELQTPEPETPMPSAEPSPSTAASASGPTVPPATEVSVQYQGPFVLDSYYKDLDLVPPARRSLTAGGELWYGRYKGFNADEDASIAVWNERSVPTYEDCRHVATAAGIETVDTHDLEEGQTVCVLTDEGRIARLKLVNKGFDEWGFDATVWDN
ncbi:hypothetical protein AWW66_01615 [Micromonospora rosaria]|uniref:Uncharacterized protein n=1 Tax=Micromonospora rosaria TaxID=47874 RepID=A0A136PZ91_9ACTN|nr:hypothetical protein AWW66_01615 [Micromonospora rosaria]